MRDLTVKLPDYSAQSRFFSVWVMFVVAMAVFAITRTNLMVYSLDNSDLSLPAILRIFATGGIYDAAFYL